MSVTLKEVQTKKDLKSFVEFPNRLYEKNPWFVPFLGADERETFTPGKNPAYAFCETKLFLAYKDGVLAGRIAGLINHAYNKKWQQNAIRFTRFDFIDDHEVSSALFTAVVDWGKARGFTRIMGPIGFTDMDHEGMLIEGFEEFNMSITFYNHPYYLDHMEKLGLVKDIDWIEFRINVPEEPDARIRRIAEHQEKKYGLTRVVYHDRKLLYKDAFEAFGLIDQAFSVLYGTVPLTPEVIKHAVDGYVPLVKPEYICSVKDAEGRIVGFRTNAVGFLNEHTVAGIDASAHDEVGGHSGLSVGSDAEDDATAGICIAIQALSHGFGFINIHISFLLK